MHLPDGHLDAELIHESATSRVWSAMSMAVGRRVVLKEYHSLDPNERELRCRREFSLLELIDSDRVVAPISVLGKQDRCFLVLELVEGCTSLRSRLQVRPLSLGQIVRLGGALAQALDQIHGARVLHCDIKPDNILVSDHLDRVVVVDFGTSLALDARGRTDAGAEFEGTLHYAAPERLHGPGRAIDHRSDFYSLGATLYELITGSQPFADCPDKDALQHAHLARSPQPLRQAREDCPLPLVQLVETLLAKVPDERYQSSFGLRHDLSHLEAEGHDSPFVHRQKDGPELLALSERLYGREGQLAQLKNAQLQAASGARVTVRITGRSGTGKSRLAQTLIDAPGEGRIIPHGKFDVYDHNEPYSAWLAVLRQLLAAIACAPHEAIVARKTAIHERLGRQVHLLTRLLPELSWLVGSGEPCDPLDAAAEKRRLQSAVCELLYLCAPPSGPLVLVLDDMQWADMASLELIEMLFAQAATRGLLLITGQRDDEVDAAHPWARCVAQLKEKGHPLIDISVGPLCGADVEQLLYDALADAPLASNLAEVVVAKSGGNPYFVHQFIYLMQSSGCLWLDRELGRWQADTERARALAATDNMADILVERLKTLPSQCEELLSCAATIGDPFDLSVLSALFGQQALSCARQLRPAIAAGLIHCDNSLAWSDAADDDALTHVSYNFVHDRVREAAHDRRPEQNQEFDLRLALYYVKQKGTAAKTAMHANRAIARIAKPHVKFAECNFRAGAQAMRSGAHRVACEHFERAQEFLGDSHRQPQHQTLAFSSLLQRTTCAHLLGQGHEAQRLLDELWQLARTRIDRLNWALLNTRVQDDCDRPDVAIAGTRRILAELGQDIGLDPSKFSIAWRLIWVRLRLSDSSIEGLRDAPILDNEEIRLLQATLHRNLSSVYKAGHMQLYVHIALLLMSLTLRHGMSAIGAASISVYAMLESVAFGNIDRARRATQISLELVERFDDPEAIALTHFNQTYFTSHWYEPRDRLREEFQRAFRRLDSCGAHMMAIGALGTESHLALLLGSPLEQSQQIFEQIVVYMRGLNIEDDISLQESMVEMCRRLRLGAHAQGEEPLPSVDEQLPQAHAYHGWAQRLFGSLLWHSYDSVALSLDRLTTLKDALRGSLVEAMVTTLAAMGHWRLATEKRVHGGESSKHEARKALTRAKKMLTWWRTHCPDNARCAYHLISALQADVKARSEHRDLHLAAAIRAGHQDRQPHFAAMAAEIVAELALADDRANDAVDNFQQAAELYAQWGARSLELRTIARAQTQLQAAGHTNLCTRLWRDQLQQPAQEQPAPRSRSGPRQTQGTSHRGHSSQTLVGQAHSDADSVLLRASQQLSQLTRTDELMTAMIRLMVELGAATTAIVFAYDPELSRLEVQAAGRVRSPGETDGETGIEVRIAPNTFSYPESVVLRSARSHSTVRLSQAHVLGPHVRDPHIAEHGVKSLLCLPLARHGQLALIAYLENTHVADLYGTTRIAIMRALGDQLAISLQNSALVSDLESNKSELEAAVVRAEAADAAKTLFLENMSHELRTPLNGIVNNCEFLADTQLDEEQQDILNDLTISGDRLARSIENILDFADLKRGEVQLVPSAHRVSTLLDRLHSAFAGLASSTATQLKFFSTAPQESRVTIDLERVARMMGHLLDNALEYAKGGTVQVRVELCAREGELGHDHDHDHVSETGCGGGRGKGAPVVLTLEVHDNGVGIDEDTLPRIFETFEQGDASSTKAHGGTGIGLASVHQNVQLMGGDIQVQSTPGRGSSFMIHIPVIALLPEDCGLAKSA